MVREIKKKVDRILITSQSSPSFFSRFPVLLKWFFVMLDLKFNSSLLMRHQESFSLYNRMPPEVKMIVKVAGVGMPRDDEIHIYRE